MRKRQGKTQRKEVSRGEVTDGKGREQQMACRERGVLAEVREGSTGCLVT